MERAWRIARLLIFLWGLLLFSDSVDGGATFLWIAERIIRDELAPRRKFRFLTSDVVDFFIFVVLGDNGNDHKGSGGGNQTHFYIFL